MANNDKKYIVVQDNGYTLKLRDTETGREFYYHPAQGDLGIMLSRNRGEGK